MDVTSKIYEIVKQIPRGKVVTYGQIALRLRSGSSTRITPRMVGKILHMNPDPAGIPCHRVVNSKGRIAENYAFGGLEAQRKKLISESVKFRNATHVELVHLA